MADQLWLMTRIREEEEDWLLLLLLCVKMMDPAASTFDFNTIGIKEIFR